MVNNFFSGLSKTQLVVFILLIFVVLILGRQEIASMLRQTERRFNAATSGEYEPWNPENINSLKDQISLLDKEFKQVDLELNMLPSYREDVVSSRKMVQDIQLDSTYQRTLSEISPNVVIGSVDNYNEFDPNAERVYIRRKILVKIDSKRNVYFQTYRSLADELGFSFNSNSYGNYNNYADPSYYSSLLIPKTGERLPFVTADQKFREGKAKLVEGLDSLSSILLSTITELKTKRADMMQKQLRLGDQFNKSNFNINQYAVVIGIPFFIIAALLMYWFGLRSDSKSGTVVSDSGIDPKDKFAFALDTITVLLLILSLLILGLSKVIQENTLAALLGTIGGYVLNNKNKEPYIPPGIAPTAVTSGPAGSSVPNPVVPPPPPAVANIPPLEA